MTTRKGAREVLVEVTYQVRVPLVGVGDRDVPLTGIRHQREAEQLVNECISSMDWGGYSMLGKAFTRAGQRPWEAVRMKVVHRPLATMAERLAARRSA